MGRHKKQPPPDPKAPTCPQYRVKCREFKSGPRYVLETADYHDENYSVFRFRQTYSTVKEADEAGHYFVAENPLDLRALSPERFREWCDYLDRLSAKTI